MEDLSYPIGRFDRSVPMTADRRARLIEDIAATPERLRAAAAGLTDAQLDTPYREGGWTVRQVLHHVPDSHMNAYIRFKWCLTEDRPLIKTYNQSSWAALDDSRDTPVAVSLDLLTALHDRWVRLLRSMSEADYARVLQHPEWGDIPLDTMLALYGWHGLHHTAHITRLRERMGW